VTTAELKLLICHKFQIDHFQTVPHTFTFKVCIFCLEAAQLYTPGNYAQREITKLCNYYPAVCVSLSIKHLMKSSRSICFANISYFLLIHNLLTNSFCFFKHYIFFVVLPTPGTKAGSEILQAVVMMSFIFWDTMACSQSMSPPSSRVKQSLLPASGWLPAWPTLQP
jgi:hypothetical protein